MLPVATSRRLYASRVLPFLFANLGLFALLPLAPAQSAAAATDTFYVRVTSDDFSGSFSNLNGTAGNCPANDIADSATCSLRDAVTAANADSNPMIVDLSTLSGTITLANPLPPVFPNTANTIVFAGPGATTLTVSGANAYQVFQVLKGTATFNAFTVANGNVVPIPNGGTFGPNNGCSCDPGFGGGIYVYTAVSLTLNSMVFNNNYSGYDGGAVLATGPLTVTNTTFSNNSVAAGSYAAALYALGGPATISNSTFYGNTAYVGSAIYISAYIAGMTLTISDSTFVNNPTPNGGSGAIFNPSGATLNIHDSTLWNNISGLGEGGALNNSGTMTVTDSVVGAPGTPTATQLCYSTTTCPATGDGNGNVVGGDSLDLSPLGNYGGFTETMLPEAGSPVICAGKSGTPYAETVSGTALTTDQRGMALDSSCSAGAIDAGAVQVNSLCRNPNPNPNPNAQSFANPGDFNGDCKSDILWQNSSTGQLYEWYMNGTSTLSQVTPGGAPSPWTIAGEGDFNGDGMADILWRNTTTGEIYLWLTTGTTTTTQTSLGIVSTAWSIVGVGDFNGDGKCDILWWNSSTGQLYIWFMNGAQVTGQVTPGSASSPLTIVGVGDFNGDGKADILFRNSTTGQVYIWLMNGATVTSQQTPGSAPSPLSIVGVGDFDGDGKSDILLWNSSTGAANIWFMNGGTVTSQQSPGSASSPWSIVAVGDFNGDGKADIVWRNSSTGQVYVWLMNGATTTTQQTPGGAPSPWEIFDLAP